LFAIGTRFSLELKVCLEISQIKLPLSRFHNPFSGTTFPGSSLSEEPYSGEDKRLLASIASQTGVALESLGLAEQLAEKMAAELRAGYELEIALKVRSRLAALPLPKRSTPGGGHG